MPHIIGEVIFILSEKNRIECAHPILSSQILSAYNQYVIPLDTNFGVKSKKPCVYYISTYFNIERPLCA